MTEDPDGSVPGLLQSFIAEVAELRADIDTLPARFEMRDEAEEKARELKRHVDEREHRVRRLLYQAGVVLALLLVAWIVWRVYDGNADAKRRQRDEAAAIAQAEEDRQNLLRGCERSNDQRATLREVIGLAVAGSGAAIPTDGLDPEIVEILRQSQIRSVELRARLLALPGVQPIDCAMAFPPAQPSKENT